MEDYNLGREYKEIWHSGLLYDGLYDGGLCFLKYLFFEIKGRGQGVAHNVQDIIQFSIYLKRAINL